MRSRGRIQVENTHITPRALVAPQLPLPPPWESGQPVRPLPGRRPEVLHSVRNASDIQVLGGPAA